MQHLPPRRPAVLGRRTFLVGVAASGALAACAGDSSEGGADADSADPSSNSTATAPDTTEPLVADGKFNLIGRFPTNVLVAGDVRLPYSLSDERAGFVQDGPTELSAQVVDFDGNEIGPRLTAARHDVLPAAYYPFRAQVDEPGIYGLIVDGGPPEGANFQVFEREQVPVPLPGDLLAGFDTPTVGESAGVDPICTRDPDCEFHSVTLTEALSLGLPVAYCIGTPAFCQTGSCAPALDALVDVGPDYADRIAIVHAEVFTDLTASTLAPAVNALSMTFEPALFITAPDGTIIERIDGLWDAPELRERFDAALA